MKKLIIAALSILAPIAAARAQQTPNLQFWLPPYGQLNWETPINSNTTYMDLLLSGNAPLPGLSVTGPAILPQLQTWQTGTTYSQSQVVAYQGAFYSSIASANLGNLPTNTTFWTTSIGSGVGGNLPTAANASQVPSAVAPGTAYSAQYIGGLGVVLADNLPGANCGAKINTALGIIGSNPGNVEITPACGAISTAVTLGTNQHIYARPGTYPTTASVTLSGRNATVYCDPASDAPDTGYGSCIFFQSNGANLSSVFTLTGTNTALDNVSVNGNGANNTASGPNVLVTGLRARLSYLTSQGSHSHGVTVGNGTTNVAAATKINHSMILGNSGDGIHCLVTSDLFVSDQTEIENNGGNGITLTNCGGSRVLSANDISGNALDGVQINGTSIAAVSGFNVTVSGNYLSSNGQNDVEIDGWDAVNLSYASTSNIVSGNIFQGSQIHGNGTYSAIYIYTSGYNAIAGNVIQDPFGSSFKFLAGVNIVQGGGLFEQADTISGNNITTLGTPIISTSTTVQGTNAVNDQPGPVTGALNLSPTSQSTSVTGFGQGTGIQQGSFALNWYNPTTATSSFSFPAPVIGDCSNYYQSSTSNLLCIVQQLYFSPNSGSTPAAVYQFSPSTAIPSAGFQWLFGGGPINAQFGYQYNGAPGVTKTCGATVVVQGGIVTSC